MPPPAEGEDVRSIHFLPFPEPKEAYTDEAVQVAVRRLLSIITITRNLRLEKALDLKVRFISLVDYLSSLKSSSRLEKA